MISTGVKRMSRTIMSTPKQRLVWLIVNMPNMRLVWVEKLPPHDDFFFALFQRMKRAGLYALTTSFVDCSVKDCCVVAAFILTHFSSRS